MFRTITSSRIVQQIARANGAAAAASAAALAPTSAFRYSHSAPASSLVSKFDDAITALPMRSAVRYTTKNMKWTAGEFKMYTEAHANALIQYEFKPGETVAVWLPDCAEKHVVMMAAAMAGLKIVELDYAIGSVADIRGALKEAQCKAIYFQPEDADKNSLKLLRQSIPEFFEYDDTHGQWFHSKYFPTLKYFIHTGFDVEMGCLNFKGIFLHHPPVSAVENLKPALSDSMPLYTKISPGASAGAVAVSAVATHAEALQLESFAFARKLIEKEYFEAL